VRALQPARVDPGGRERLRDPPGLADPEVLERLAQLVLGVGGVECVQRRAALRAAQCLGLERDQGLGRIALDPGLDEARDRADHDVDGLGQLHGRAARGRRRVVELVREPGGHRAERGEPLAVLLDRRDAGHDRRDLAHHAVVHGRVREGEPAEVLALDHADPARRLGGHADAERAARQHRDRVDPGRRDLAADGLEAVALDHLGAQHALEQQHHPAGVVALVGHDLVGADRALGADRRPRLQRLVVEVVEEVDPAQVGGGDHASTRYWWTSVIAIEPSPTALATRLIERARTSPATNTPGTEVSSR
jgi:hypothetical protein